MALFNRIVVIWLLLILIPLVTIVLIVPREAVEVLSDALDELYSQLDRSATAWQLAARIGMALLIDALLVVLLYMEVRRAAAFGVRVRQAKGGDAQIAINSVIEQLQYHIDRLPSVLDVSPKITPRRGAVVAELDIELAADSDLPANVDEVSALVRRVVEDEMGLKLRGKPRLNLRTMTLPEPLDKARIQEPLLPASEQRSAQGGATPPDDVEAVLADDTDDMQPGDMDEPGNVDDEH